MTTQAKRPAKEYLVHIDPALCDGCGICLFFCRPKVFEKSPELNSRGSFPAVAVRPEDCTGCLLCEVGCPQLAISIEQKNDNPAKAGRKT